MESIKWYCVVLYCIHCGLILMMIDWRLIPRRRGFWERLMDGFGMLISVTCNFLYGLNKVVLYCIHCGLKLMKID